jgi:flagellar hook-basal body complex protein FliE
MEISNNYDVFVKTTNPKHLGQVRESNSSNVEKSFGEALLSAIDGANKSQLKSRELEELAVVSPEEVDVNDIMIAEEESRLSLLFVKTVIDKGISAWRELLNLR